MAIRRAYSFEDSILDRMLASRVLGLNTFPMGWYLCLFPRTFCGPKIYDFIDVGAPKSIGTSCFNPPAAFRSRQSPPRKCWDHTVRGSALQAKIDWIAHF
jgi:hypothetical protein